MTTEKRAPVLPDVPAVAETVPGYSMSTWYGAVAPAKVPREIVQRLNQEIRDSVDILGFGQARLLRLVGDGFIAAHQFI